jgi:hypothetical protein
MLVLEQFMKAFLNDAPKRPNTCSGQADPSRARATTLVSLIGSAYARTTAIQISSVYGVT